MSLMLSRCVMLESYVAHLPCTQKCTAGSTAGSTAQHPRSRDGHGTFTAFAMDHRCRQASSTCTLPTKHSGTLPRSSYKAHSAHPLLSHPLASAQHSQCLPPSGSTTKAISPLAQPGAPMGGLCDYTRGRARGGGGGGTKTKTKSAIITHATTRHRQMNQDDLQAAMTGTFMDFTSIVPFHELERYREAIEAFPRRQRPPRRG